MKVEELCKRERHAEVPSTVNNIMCRIELLSTTATKQKEQQQQRQRQMQKGRRKGKRKKDGNADTGSEKKRARANTKPGGPRWFRGCFDNDNSAAAAAMAVECRVHAVCKLQTANCKLPPASSSSAPWPHTQPGFPVFIF